FICGFHKKRFHLVRRQFLVVLRYQEGCATRDMGCGHRGSVPCVVIGFPADRATRMQLAVGSDHSAESGLSGIDGKRGPYRLARSRKRYVAAAIGEYRDLVVEPGCPDGDHPGYC